MPCGNTSLTWYRTDTGASVGKVFTPANGITYVSEPTTGPGEAGAQGFSFDFVSAASTAGTLTVEVSNTERSRAIALGGVSGPATGCAWNTYAPPGWSIAAISGVGVATLVVTQAGPTLRARMKFVSSAAAGSVYGDGSCG